MAPATLRARATTPKFLWMKLNLVLLWEKDQQLYHLKFVNLISQRFITVQILHLKSAHTWSIVSYYSLLLTLLALNLYGLQANLLIGFLITGLQTSPLLLFIRGLHSSHSRSLIWLCFLSLVYFTQGVMNALSNVHSFFGWGIVIVSILLFASLTISIRSNNKKLRKTRQKDLPVLYFFYQRNSNSALLHF